MTSRPPPARLPSYDGPPPELTADVVVVGGGINGCGVARDLALRGAKVVLLERNDLAFGASGNSSGMIHGGVRYLTSNPKVTRTSCADAGYVLRIAPHLMFRIPFLMPVKAGAAGRIMLELVDAFFRVYDDFQPEKRGERHTRLTPDEVRRLEPGLKEDLVGAVTFDEWGVDGARLCTLNALDAREHGATILVHTTLEALHPVHRTTVGSSPDESAALRSRYVLLARDRVTGARTRIAAASVVNATGAWSPITAALSGLPANRVRVRPGKGVHVVYDRRLSNFAIVSKAIDGRQVFLEPWENMSVLGTTDDDYYGDLDDVVATSEEVRYLVQAMARVFPGIRAARAIGTYAGVRPTLHTWGPYEDALSREHAIIDHGADGAPYAYSMIGGKLASYRLFAQELADVLAPRLGLSARCTTHERPLPGGERTPDAYRVAEQAGVPYVAARRLVFRHGERAHRIVERMRARPRERAVVCPCEPVTEAEVRHVVSEELAQTVDDVSRRTRLGLGACGGMRCAARCGQIVADLRGLPSAEGARQARAFLVRAARTRFAALGPEQARQEALTLAHVAATYGPDGAGDGS